MFSEPCSRAARPPCWPASSATPAPRSRRPISRRITYSIYLLDDNNPDRRDAVSGHNNVTLDVAAVVTNRLQVDPLWTVNAVGYNFSPRAGRIGGAGISPAGRQYLVEYRLVPAAGATILVPLRLNAI